MKNYKILENRTELSKEQLTQGMDFNKVKTNATIAKTAILKSFIIKGILGVAFIGSGIFVYKLITGPEIKSNPVTLMDSTKNINLVVIDSIMNIDKTNNDSIIVQNNKDKKTLIIPNSISISSIDTLKEIITSNKTNNPIIVEKEVVKNENKQAIDSIVNNQEIQIDKINNQKMSKVTIVKSCKIWNTKDFCDVPKSAKFAASFDCDGVEFDYIDCQTANQIIEITGVWLSIGVNEKSKLKIEDQLKNFILVKTNNKKQYPLMIKISGENNFWGAKFKAKKITVNYNKQIDIFLFFKNAAVGDKIIINNLIEALIEQ